MPTDQDIAINRTEDAVIPFAPATPTDITGWALGFSASRGPGRPVLAGFPLTIGAGITVTDPTSGKFTVAIAAAVTTGLVAGSSYSWDLWRLNNGTAWPLAQGFLLVEEPVRQ